MIFFVFLLGLAAFALSLFTSFIFIESFHVHEHMRSMIYWIAILFTLLFIFSFALSKAKPSEIGNWFYTLIMSIAGYGVYLFLASVVLAVILSIYGFIGKILPLSIATTTFALGLLAGIIGSVQSWFITIREFSVNIQNLPASWKNRRAVLVTDTHFGNVRRERFARKIVQKIEELNPSFVLHAGDFYDGPNIHTSELTTIWKTLTEKIPVFYTSGNHEHYGNYETFITSIRDAGITVLEDTKTFYDGVQMAGITYRNTKEDLEAKRAIAGLGLDASMPSILINHPPWFHEDISAASVSLMVSGHTHRGQFWPGNYISKMVYGKFHDGIHMYKTMTAITSRGVGTAGPPLRFLNSPELVVIRFE